MAWRDIFAFMCARDPSLARSVVPVPADAIAEVQHELGIKLPAMCVDFLITMGGSAAAYHPFGPTQDHNFFRIVDSLPPKFNPATDYFKVTRCIFYDIEPEDYFLDLRRPVEDDTPLVYIGFAGTFSRHHVHNLGYTLAEMLTRWAIVDFEISPKPHRATVNAQAETGLEALRLHNQALALLGKLGMEALLPPQPRVVGIGKADCVAKVEVEEELLSIEIGCQDQASLRHTTDLLVEGLAEDSNVKIRKCGSQ